MFLIKYVL